MKVGHSVVASNSAGKETTSIPQKCWFLKRLGNNRLSQLKYASFAFQGHLTPGETFHLRGEKIFVSDKQIGHVPDGHDDILFLTKSGDPEWLKKSEIAEPKWDAVIERRVLAADSIEGKFKFVEEQRNADRTIKAPGLRPPQTGAVFTALGHWKSSTDLATVVMPTGTGKTDAMIAIMAIERPSCLLVVVPTDPLRKQLAEKFLTLGLLVDFGLLPPDTTYPVVGILKSGFENTTEIKTFCDACNVVVTTMSLLATFSDLHQKALASHSSHLFIDEAHHVRAVTWNRLRERFRNKPILQFTATPYRNDGRHVDGKIIFNYPLRKAQEEGYFQKITLKELWDYVEPDECIAKAAIEQLKADLRQGLDHIVMARAANIVKAEAIAKLYSRFGQEFSPLVVHSDLSQKELNSRMDQLAERKSRIAICVAMFGEGFDFPQLKIAALHDIHQSLAVTIQFTGRFTRSHANVGSATIIVNRSDVEVNDSVRELYAQGEGADWNHVLTRLTEGATQDQISKESFYRSFNADSSLVPIQNVAPKMSTVVYQTNARWAPWKIKESPFATNIQGEVSISLNENTAFFVTLDQESVDWAEPAELTNRTYNLYALFWDANTHLLYINSSNNASVHEDLAKLVTDGQANLISGVQTFRVMHGIKRLLLRNMGLNDRLRRSVRFMMFTGSDIQAYLDTAQSQGKEKTHVFGDGFDGNSHVTIGTSKKGRIWSWKEAKDLLEWKKWCVEIGAKLLDSTIEPDLFLQDSMIPEDIVGPPDLYPLTIEWPDEFYQRMEDSVFIQQGSERIPFFNVGLDLVNPAPKAPIRFRISTEEGSTEYKMRFAGGRISYVPEATDLVIWIGKRTFKLSEYLAVAHPLIRYEKDCFSRGDQLLRPRTRTLYIFNPERVLVWKWNNVDLTKESQTIARYPDSIQRRTIETISSPVWDRTYQIIFDDDAPGEAADVIGIAVSNGKFMLDLFHCKFSGGDAGRRVKDLYEVCGQAQRSIKWRADIDRLLMHMVNREKNRMKKHGVSRFERGSFKALQEMRAEARALVPEARIFVVQPGLSKAKISDDQRELLSTTDVYLHETLSIYFGVIASE